jgi:hypothetical protein
MLDVARGAHGESVEWVLGDLASKQWQEEFNLITMTGHAFQVLTEDEELRVALAAVRAALAPGGRFAFETRNPLVRAWERWIPEHWQEITDSAGVVVRLAHQVELPVQGDLVSFTSTYSSPSWEHPQVSRSTLRFVGADALSGFLVGSGLEIEEQYGDWEDGIRNMVPGQRPSKPILRFSPDSPEIITICRASGD